MAPPGTQFAYSSYGYDVIGAALERATNESFGALMRQAVFAPADLNETTLATAPAARRSSFYELTSHGKVRAAPAIDLSDRLPAGGLIRPRETSPALAVRSSTARSSPRRPRG